MTLPTHKTPPKSALSDYSILLYGPPKVGKSTTASQFPDALFLATEPGLNALEVFQVPIKTWPELTGAIDELAAGKHKFRTVVIDTIDLAYQACSDWTCEQNKVKALSDLGYGKGFSMCNSEFQRALTRLAHMPSGLVLISHAVDREITTRTSTYSKTMPTLPGKAREIVTGLCDCILLADVEPIRTDGKVTGYARVLRTKPTQAYEAGDRTGRLPETVALSYDALLDAFTKGGNK